MLSLVVPMVMAMMVVLARGLHDAGAASELVDQLDELVRRGVMFPGHVAGLDRDGPVLQDRQLHFGFHDQTPFRNVDSPFTSIGFTAISRRSNAE